jgi:hypothetical protein
MISESAYKSFELPGYDYYMAAKIEGMPQSVELRHMTIKEVKYFSQLAVNSDLNKFLDNILRSCCKTKIDWNQLLDGDRIYFFYMIRALTMDNIYAFDVNCEECGKVIRASADLFALPIKKYDPNNGFPIKMTLPKSKALIEVILPTRVIEKEVEAELAKFTKELPYADKPEEEYTMRKLIKSINGSSDTIEMVKFISDMHLLDYKYLDKHLNEMLPGLDLDVIVPCEDIACNHHNLVTFSVRPNEFFRLGDQGVQAGVSERADSSDLR